MSSVKKMNVHTMHCHLCAKKFKEGDRIFMDPKDGPIKENTKPRLYCITCAEQGLVGEHKH